MNQTLYLSIYKFLSCSSGITKKTKPRIYKSRGIDIQLPTRYSRNTLLRIITIFQSISQSLSRLLTPKYQNIRNTDDSGPRHVRCHYVLRQRFVQNVSAIRHPHISHASTHLNMVARQETEDACFDSQLTN